MLSADIVHADPQLGQSRLTKKGAEQAAPALDRLRVYSAMPRIFSTLSSSS
jgi:hypothetical protein